MNCQKSRFIHALLLIWPFVTLSCAKRRSSPEPTHSCSNSNTFYELRSPLYSFGENESYEATVNECIFSPEDQHYCSLQQFPFIGKSKETISIDDILLNTFTTHQWMKSRFAELLQSYPSELLQMFRHVTAVIISAEARPSHYWSAHGAIILDPNNLWLSPEEKDDIFELEDCRAANFRKKELNFKVFSFDFLNDQPFSFQTRSLETIKVDLGTLLAHELAHAMDYTAGIDLNTVKNQAIFQLQEQQDLLSARLYQENNLALTSNLLSKAAAYFFKGTPADEELKSATGSDMGQAFSNSGASALYAYTNQREDFAMLIEHHLGRKIWGLGVGLLVTDAPEEPESCRDYTMKFSQYNRDLSDSVGKRMLQAVTSGVPTLEATNNREQEAFANLSYSTDFTSTDVCKFLNNNQ